MAAITQKEFAQMPILTAVARDILPPVITRTLRPPTKYGPWGHYPSWEAASAAAAPYHTYFPIVEDHLTATMRGEHEPPCFTGLLFAAILASSKPVNVLDFGGGVGLAYFRAMVTIPDRINSWRVVELPDVVERGRKLPKDPRLTFHQTINEAVAGGTKLDIVTCSSVLQCMEDSYDALTELFAIGARYVHLDRLPLERRERYSVFHTVSGERIAWRVLSRDRLNGIAGKYRLLYQQTLPKHPVENDASFEYTMLYG